MSNESMHNDSSILREFSSQYEEMCSQNKEQAATIEDLKQEVHSLRQRLVVAEKIQVEYQSELDCQQQQLNEANELASATALKLKEDHAITVKELEDKIHNLECKLQEVAEVQTSDKEELLKARKELKDVQDASLVATLKAELQDIMEEHAANRLACVQHVELNQVLLKEKAYLIEELNSTREHLEMTEEKLKICKQDLAEQTETLEDLRESLAVVQNELTCMQSGPPTDEMSRGNSLFAEVEDKRQAMLKQTKVLSKKYTEMKRDYGAKCAEISRLKMENLQLHEKWREEAEERDNRDVWLEDNYEIRIKELTKLVADLKREEKPVFLNGSSEILTYADHLVKKSKQEIQKLREEMESRSATRLNEAKALFMARSKVQSLKSEVMLLNAENLVLRDKLEQADITDIPLPGKTLMRIKEVWEQAIEAPVSHRPANEVQEPSSPSKEVCNPYAPQLISPTSEANECCSPAIEAQSFSTVDGESDGCSSPAAGFHEVPDSDEPEDTAQMEELGSSPPVSSNSVPITSCFSKPPKPQRLLRMELMEKLQLEGNADLEKDMQLESAVCAESPSGSDVQLEDATPSPLEHHEEQEHSLTLETDHAHEPVTSSTLMEPANTLQDKKQDGVCDGETLSPPDLAQYDEPSTPTFKEPCEVTNENWIEPPFESRRPPRQSILTKPARPSLMPVDQNLMRRVRFADASSPPVKEEKSQTTEQKSPPKKKLPKVPKTYKTKFIVSKELD